MRWQSRVELADQREEAPEGRLLGRHRRAHAELIRDGAATTHAEPLRHRRIRVVTSVITRAVGDLMRVLMHVLMLGSTGIRTVRAARP
jgi:hypothetical protein